MRLSDDEIQEWHEIIYNQRRQMKWFLESICTGVPTTAGMASKYRELTLKEIKDRAKQLLSDEPSR
jgi:hypothetical protein